MLYYAKLLYYKELVKSLYAELCTVMQGIPLFFLGIDNKIDNTFLVFV